MSLSGLCLVHCLVLPLAAAALPLVGSWAESAWVHIGLVMIAAPVAARALLVGRRAPAVIALGGGGIALLIFGAFGPHAAEHAATVAGSLMLVLAHLLNWRLGRRSGLSENPDCALAAP